MSFDGRPPPPPAAPPPPPRDEGTRLDLWLVDREGLSRPAARRLVDGGWVSVNGRPGRAGQRVRDGDAVRVATPPPEAAAPPPAAIATAAPVLAIVYEDSRIAVINKPAGLVVHPAPGHPDGTVADALRQRGDTWAAVGGGERAGIVHRLDRFTSGLMVVAKTEAAHHALSSQLASRTLGRTYWALAWGGFREAAGRIEAPIGRHPHERKRMAVIGGGREAATEFVVAERMPQATALEVSLRSGRTHQIRVHLAHIGRPVVGDPTYGRRDDRHAGRPALHAMRLRLRYPGTGEPMEFEAPLPEDLLALRELARDGRL
ncbi:MAG TPA: RluA family pseudouridine synthase [Candidatus Dormibacteraeota bacterium]